MYAAIIRSGPRISRLEGTSQHYLQVREHIHVYTRGTYRIIFEEKWTTFKGRSIRNSHIDVSCFPVQIQTGYRNVCGPTSACGVGFNALRHFPLATPHTNTSHSWDTLCPTFQVQTTPLISGHSISELGITSTPPANFLAHSGAGRTLLYKDFAARWSYELGRFYNHSLTEQTVFILFRRGMRPLPLT